MDLLQLEHFLAVAEEGNFTRAAERVCRTQPAVSLSVKKLEDVVGARLFTRDAHEVSLTEAGRTLAEYARRMVRMRDEVMRRLAEQRSLDSGNLAVAAHESAAVYLLPGPVRRYFDAFPHIKVGVYRSRLDEIPRQVMDREVDIGFVKEKPAFHELQSVLVHSDEMVLVAAGQHPLADRSQVTVRDLDREPFVLHHLCASTAERILRLFEAHGTRCRIAAELSSFENIKQFVRQGVGLAVVPRVSVARELDAGVLAEIPVPGVALPRQTYMVFRGGDGLSPAAQQFADLVAKFDWRSWLDAGDEDEPAAPRLRPRSRRPRPRPSSIPGGA
jgi:LysR family transcriptional regulator, low CO2-responsive transcriptional regulator